MPNCEKMRNATKCVLSHNLQKFLRIPFRFCVRFFAIHDLFFASLSCVVRYPRIFSCSSALIEMRWWNTPFHTNIHEYVTIVKSEKNLQFNNNDKLWMQAQKPYKNRSFSEPERSLFGPKQILIIKRKWKARILNIWKSSFFTDPVEKIYYKLNTRLYVVIFWNINKLRRNLLNILVS